MPKTGVERSQPLTYLPGAIVLARVRRLLILTLICSLVYSALTTASRTTCPGGFDGGGGYLDGNGDPTEIAPTCLSLSLQPNPLIFVVLALVVIGAISSALKKSTTETDALRYIDSAAAVVGVLVAVCVVVGHIWFWRLPASDWAGGDATLTAIYRLPFAVVETEISPLLSN